MRLDSLVRRVCCTVLLFPLAARAFAQSDVPEVRVSVPLPHMLDVKTPAPPNPPATTLEPRGALRSTGREGVAPAAPTGSERQPPPRRFSRTIDFSQVCFDAPGDGSLWAHGATYKASFAGGVFTYIPFFGSRAPRNFPLAVSLESARVGELDVVTGLASAPQRSADRVVVDRTGMVELFDLDPHGVKQEFVFDSLPRTGDLRLRLAVETELHPSSSGARVEFGNELGLVTYSDALVLDAAGRSERLATTWRDGAIEIVVPQEFLARAHFPLSIDPLWSTIFVDTTFGVDDSSPDIAYEATQAHLAVCWERVFSATDHDVWTEQSMIFGLVVILPGSRQPIDITNANWQHPRIASQTLAGQFLVVASVGDPAAGARNVSGRTVESDAPYAVGPQFAISGTEAGDKFDPDVGGDSSGASPSYYCVVWTRGSSPTDRDVHARLVKSDSTLLGTSTILLDNSMGTFDVHPSVSKSNGPLPSSLEDWNVAWEREVGGPGGQGDIHAAQIHWNGIVTTPSFPALVTSWNDETPSASSGLDIGGVRYYGIAYARDYGDRDIEVSVFHGATSVASAPVSVLEDEFTGRLYHDQFQPTIDVSEDFFHIACVETVSGLFWSEIRESVVAFNGTSAVLAEAPLLESAVPFAGYMTPEITSFRSGGATAGSLACGTVFAVTMLDVAGYVTSLPAGGPVRSFCSGDGSAFPCPCASGSVGAGCPNSIFASGATLSATGHASVSGDTIVLHGAQMPNSTAIYLQGTSATAPFVIDDGIACIGGSIIRLASKVNAANASQFPAPGDPPVSVRGAIPALAAVTRTYQVYYRNAASFCTPFTTNRTNALSATWIP